MEEMHKLLNTPLVSMGDNPITIGQALSVLVFALVGGLFVFWSTRFLRRHLHSRTLNADVVQIITRAWLIVGLVILVFMVLDILRVPLGAFAFISGAVAIGVGFGAQNIINNFISGWILMWERPIKIGDFLELGEMRGTVEAINTRSTRIRRVDGVHLLVPNSQLLENTVTNWTLVDRLVRTSVVVGVAYGSDVELTRKLLLQVAEENPNVLKEPAFQVFFEDFGDSALVFELQFWIHSAAERGLRTIRSDLRFRIDALFREHQVVIAFPQRDVHIDGEVRIRSSD
ncbi:mechanosensitive ion channel family protein [Haliea sp. E17]|uniref:mechanosensitive ion channel family protein n=1 Tax=Haliea sp. E17 TaxID=3401576 RepID=UPI003AAF7D1F